MGSGHGFLIFFVIHDFKMLKLVNRTCKNQNHSEKDGLNYLMSKIVR